MVVVPKNIQTYCRSNAWGKNKLQKISRWAYTCFWILHSVSILLGIYWTFFRGIKSSAAVAYPLRGLTHCVPRCSSAYHCCNAWLFALLSHSCQLQPVWPFSSALSLPMRFCPQNCCSEDVFCFSYHSLQTIENVLHENPRISAVSEILNPSCLTPHCQRHFDHISSPFWHLVWKKAERLGHVWMSHMIG